MAPSSSTLLGLDIGGANIKAADDLGRTASIFFPMWKTPNALAEQLRQLCLPFQQAQRVAITMTGELADCFFTREDGVRHIVDHCDAIFGDRCCFYTVDGTFVTAADAKANIEPLCASNWHATASLAAQWCTGEGLLIDIGSTTTDLIPLTAGKIRSTSRSDFDRLRSGELIYVGVGRTPVCSLVDALPFQGELVPLMNELFASTDDCGLLAGIIPPDAQDCDTCDGQPRTLEAARNRLARMIGLDLHAVDQPTATIMAEHVLQRARAQIAVAADILSSEAATWLVAGHGTWLLEIPENRRCLDLPTILGAPLSRVLPAYAVCRLAQRYFGYQFEEDLAMESFESLP